MADVSHRTFEEKVYDGTTGNVEHTKTTHQVGVEIDGVFVPFITKEGSYVDRLVQDGLKQQDADAKEQENQTSSAATS